MKKINIGIIQLIVGFFFISTSLSTIAQQDPSIEEIEGTYTIYISSIKEQDKTFSEDQLLEIEAVRKETEDFKTSIGDTEILIMSREKMENEFKWPKYTLKDE